MIRTLDAVELDAVSGAGATDCFPRPTDWWPPYQIPDYTDF